MIINTTRNTTIAQYVEIADTPLACMKGLLGRDSLPDGHGLVITGCQSIHMIGMTFFIDVIFVDKTGVVVGACEHIGPWQLSSVFFKANRAIEIPAGVIAKTNTKIGDVLELTPLTPL